MPDHASPSPGGEPRGLAAVQWVTVLVGVALCALAGVIARDLGVRYGSDRPDDSWVADALRWLSELPVNAWTVAAGVVFAVLGLAFLVAAVRPRPRTHVRYASRASIWLRPVDIARRATYTAIQETGSSAVRSQATRSRVRVRVQDNGQGEAMATQVRQALTETFAGLSRPPRISVTLTPPPPTSEEATR
ncbi:DUF6286 domain-containing protein [Corynebacterium timonense]|uniref:DUF6286 domain-containing protein n=1 Tax=Corynebacterium timonense TaxID=441500 RepID=A0A1H1STW0_9CORY|nr:DUF6286 domain-containing protein [Corynebacterium timonense]SDS51460.1 hypothetical protein SAMN04488539_1823 [Corynebacterium timonense]